MTLDKAVKLSPEEVRKIAKLARLALTDAETAKYAEQLSAVLGYIKQLQEVDTGDVPMTSQVTGLSNVMRPDEIIACPDAEGLIKMASAHENNLVKVKAVFE